MKLRLRNYYAGDWPAIDAFDRHCHPVRWSSADAYEYSEFGDRGLLLAEAPGKTTNAASSLVGLVAWRTDGPQRGELIRLSVDPAARRRGVGRALLAYLAERRPLVFARIDDDRFDALHFLTACGWVRVRSPRTRREHVFRSPGQNDV